MHFMDRETAISTSFNWMRDLIGFYWLWFWGALISSVLIESVRICLFVVVVVVGQEGLSVVEADDRRPPSSLGY